MDTQNPTAKVAYTLDMTRQYKNVLQKQEGNSTQSFYWDEDVIFGKDGANAHIYLQDELGSPIRLLEQAGTTAATYGYDEFGQDLYGNQGKVQPFGYTGYQFDSVADTYFAQAREYMPQAGRFTARDVISGSQNMPGTINPYIYCLNHPMDYVDLDGMKYKINGKDGVEAHEKLKEIFKMWYTVNEKGTILSGKPVAPYPQKKYGLPDLALETTTKIEVYEIKPIGHYKNPGLATPTGEKKLQAYIVALRTMHPDKLVKKGTSFNPNYLTIPSDRQPGKLIRYYTYPNKPGMIYWGYVEKKNSEQWQIEIDKEMVDVSSTALLFAGIGVVLMRLLTRVSGAAAGFPLIFNEMLRPENMNLPCDIY